MFQRPTKRRKNTDAGETTSDRWDIYRNILAILKLGFSLEDVRYMTMSEFIAYTDLAYGDVERQRNATQSDIDKFLA